MDVENAAINQKELTSTGQYGVKGTGEVITYDYSYVVYDSITDVIAAVGEAKLLATYQRQTKVDCNNVAREAAKTRNGHSTRVPLTEEQKVERKAARAQDKDMLSKINALTPEQREALGF